MKSRGHELMTGASFSKFPEDNRHLHALGMKDVGALLKLVQIGKAGSPAAKKLQKTHSCFTF